MALTLAGVFDAQSVEITQTNPLELEAGPPKVAYLEFVVAGVHNHPQYAVDGHTHKGLSVVTHSHAFAGNTNGADS